MHLNCFCFKLFLQIELSSSQMQVNNEDNKKIKTTEASEEEIIIHNILFYIVLFPYSKMS